MTDYTDLKRNMRTARNKFGADTKIGHRASNVEEAMDNRPVVLASEVAPRWKEIQQRNVEFSIRRQLTDISRLATEAPSCGA